MNFVTKNIMYLSMTPNIMKYITFLNIMFLHIKHNEFHNVFSCLLHYQRRLLYNPTLVLYPFPPPLHTLLHVVSLSFVH